MTCFDILFPINLGPLTYKCPQEFAEKAVPGMLVAAPLKNTITEGVILSRNTAPPAGRLKELSEIKGDAPVFSKGMLKLIKWMSDYYISNEGLVLKQTAPKELFLRTKSKKQKEKVYHEKIGFLDISEEDISSVSRAVHSGKYRAFLLHSPSLQYEYSFVLKLLASVQNVIILLPEVPQADLVFNSFREVFQDRVCLLHSEISKGRRSEYIEGIISGRHDIVIGMRHALFAPLKKVNFIVVLNEHSSSYKLEDGIRYNLRDVAVMRGFIEKAPVLLSSITPSIDSYYNSLSRKYHLIRPSCQMKRPLIKIVNMAFEKKIRPYISKTAYDDSNRFISKDKKVVFVINRRGHSSMLHCRACGHTEKCGVCNIPMVFHKDSNTIRCHYCGRSVEVPDKCSRCGSFELELLGAGTEKIQEEIRELFDVETLRLDSDSAKDGTSIKKLIRNISDSSAKVIIGTKMITKRIMTMQLFSMAAVLNIDGSLNLPDFRSPEKTYMELSSLIELVDPEGEVLIQTRFPQNPIFRYLRSNDYYSFIKNELASRKLLAYPPYSKMLNIRLKGNSSLADKMIRTINDLRSDIEVLGPVVLKNKKGRDEQSIMLKSFDRKLLNAAARAVMSKKTGDMNIYLDVDPA